MELYEIDRSFVCCTNCVHFDQDVGEVGGKQIGGCHERMKNSNLDFDKIHCGQFFLKQSNEEY